MKSVRDKHNFQPKTILDVGFNTKLSTLELLRKFPQARILSYECDSSNFLLDSTALAYHDNVRFAYFNINSFHIDDFIFGILSRDEIVDLITLDLNGKEEDIFKFSGMWPDSTRYVKAKLGPNYEYKQAKKDLGVLGFETYAIYDNESFYVVGNRWDLV